MTQETSSIEKFKITITLIGIKKRCRKSERHSFNLGYIDYNNGNFDRESIETLVRGYVDTNVKQVDSMIRVHLDHVTIHSEEGFNHIEWQVFSDKHVRFDIPFHY
jgi:hypothetical protein